MQATATVTSASEMEHATAWKTSEADFNDE